MEFLSKLSSNQIVLLYIMYSDVFYYFLNEKDFESAEKCFAKLAKYLDIISNTPEINKELPESEMDSLKKIFEITKTNAKKHIENIDSIDYKNVKTDSFEKLLEKESLACAFEKIAEGLISMDMNGTAINFLNEVIKLNPQNYKIYILLGDCYINTANYEKAIENYEEYIKYHQDYPNVYDVLGMLYSKLDRYNYFDKKFEYFKKAVALEPDNIDFLRHLAIAYRNSGDNITSTKYYEKIIKLNPTNDDYFNYAIQKIKLGDFKEGLRYHHYRFTREKDPTFYPKINKPKWDGKTDLKDKTLLVQYEQGFGDSIQFFRYLFEIKAKKIIYKVQDGLLDLFKFNIGSDSNIEVVKNSIPIESLDFDYHIPQVDLLEVFNVRVNNIIMSEGYIKADPKKILDYRNEFFDNNCFKIGISWSGGKKGNPYRNIPLEDFYPLTSLNNVKVYSLQKEIGTDLEKAKEQGCDITDVGSSYTSFFDTAAAISNVDLVIASDNVITNLAGAMGKNTFLLLNKDADWRWLLDEEKTPWYDSVKIFKKQHEKESWGLNIQRVIAEIQKLVP